MPESPHLSIQALQGHIAYTHWPSLRLLDAAALLPLDELEKDFGAAGRSIFGTLFHVFAAGRIWLNRLQRQPPVRPADSERNPVHLQAAYPALCAEWREWSSALTPESAASVLSYSDLKGNPWQQPVWQIVLHVVNHGTHHRGQAAGFLRSLGRVPPQLDFIHYLRARS